MATASTWTAASDAAAAARQTVQKLVERMDAGVTIIYSNTTGDICGMTPAVLVNTVASYTSRWQTNKAYSENIGRWWPQEDGLQANVTTGCYLLRTRMIQQTVLTLYKLCLFHLRVQIRGSALSIRWNVFAWMKWKELVRLVQHNVIDAIDSQLTRLKATRA